MWRVLDRLKIVVAALAILVAGETLAGPDGCPDSGLLTKGKIFTSFCWNCVFPLTMMGEAIPGTNVLRSGNVLPDKGLSRWPSMVTPCMCPGRMAGIPTPGIPIGMWQPAHLHEVVGTPFCTPTFGGLSLNSGMGNASRVLSSVQQGRQRSGDAKGFYNWHWIKFPVGAVFDVFTNVFCSPGAAMDIDFGYLTEIDFSYQSEVIANTFTPWGKAFATPIAEPVVMADKIMTAVRKPLELAVHSAGSNERNYPPSGHGNQDSTFEAQMRTAMRGLTLMHSRGLAWKSSGPAATCANIPWFVLPKQQYQIQNLWPRPSRRAPWAGTTELRSAWGVGRVIPYMGEDRVMLEWAYEECCLNW